MRWYVLEKNKNLNLPEWVRTFGLDESGMVFVPAAVAQIPERDVCKRLDMDGDIPLAEYDEHFYVPSNSLAHAFPEIADVCQLFELQATKLKS